MSYCRFSSDDWKSEVYCYEHCDGGFMVHVAGNRITSHVPELPPFPILAPDQLPSWWEAHTAQMDVVKGAVRVPLDLPHAGDTARYATAAECADGLEELRALGYHVPQSAIDQLREEASCSSAI